MTGGKAYLKQTKKGVTVAVRLQPKASKNKIIGLHAGELKISVTAPPVDGKANRALIKLLANTLGVPKTSISIQSGETGRHKTICIAGLKIDDDILNQLP